MCPIRAHRANAFRHPQLETVQYRPWFDGLCLSRRHGDTEILAQSCPLIIFVIPSFVRASPKYQ